MKERYQASRREFTDVLKAETYISVSPLLFPRICLGFTVVDTLRKQHTSESTLYFHIFDSFSATKVYGFTYRYNQFFSKKKVRKGLYWLVAAGFDYAQWRALNLFGGESNRISSICTPTLAFGLGYNFNSHFRIDFDIGWKILFSNLYFSYVW
ncbi:MAG: hypothetical protein Q7J16_12670 [Candidatus Cloacimonadales bacterium]|nr:hypothetical protein [Candidatus Cloacimonadales bacterium]